ncbi:MAG: hypothetical protein ACPGGK_05270 [Pikeienuella sp.]
MFRFFRIRKDLEFIIHIGPHRTGSRFIQRTLRRNQPLYADKATYLGWKDPLVLPVQKLMLQSRNTKLAKQNAPNIKTAMLDLTSQLETGRYVISCEDFLGRLPMRWNISGLYPNANITLKAMVQGLLKGSVKLTVCLYEREYEDWLQSVYYRRHEDAPTTGASHQELLEQFGLPPGWSDFHARVLEATKGANLRIFSFEEDRDSGIFGKSLFQEIGVTNCQLLNWDFSANQNASKTRPR